MNEIASPCSLVLASVEGAPNCRAGNPDVNGAP